MNIKIGYFILILAILTSLISCAVSNPQKEIITTDRAPKPFGNSAQAVKAGGTLYISAQFGIEPGRDRLIPGGILGETQQALQNIDSILKTAGYNLEDIVNLKVYLLNLQDYPNVQIIFNQYFKETQPVINFVQVSGLPLGALVSIGAIASK